MSYVQKQHTTKNSKQQTHPKITKKNLPDFAKSIFQPPKIFQKQTTKQHESARFHHIGELKRLLKSL